MSNEYELRRARLEYEAWVKTLRQIRTALQGDPRANAENFKQVERLRQREANADACVFCGSSQWPHRCR